MSYPPYSKPHTRLLKRKVKKELAGSAGRIIGNRCDRIRREGLRSLTGEGEGVPLPNSEEKVLYSPASNPENLLIPHARKLMDTTSNGYYRPFPCHPNLCQQYARQKHRPHSTLVAHMSDLRDGVSTSICQCSFVVGRPLDSPNTDLSPDRLAAGKS